MEYVYKECTSVADIVPEFTAEDKSGSLIPSNAPPKCGSFVFVFSNSYGGTYGRIATSRNMPPGCDKFL